MKEIKEIEEKFEERESWWTERYRRSRNENARLRKDILFLSENVKLGTGELLNNEQIIQEIRKSFKSEAFSARQLVEFAVTKRPIRISLLLQGITLNENYSSIGKKFLKPESLARYKKFNIREAHVPHGDRTEEQGTGNLYKVVEG